jgi:hypothetical protein
LHEGSQVRRYGPDRWDAYIEIEPRHNVRPTDEAFLRVARKFWSWEDEPKHWFSWTLKEFRRVDDNTAYVRIERPYDD